MTVIVDNFGLAEVNPISLESSSRRRDKFGWLIVRARGRREEEAMQDCCRLGQFTALSMSRLIAGRLGSGIGLSLI